MAQGDQYITPENSHLTNEMLLHKMIINDANNQPVLNAHPSIIVPREILLDETLLDFGDVTINTFSSAITYNVSGTNLAGNIVITAPANFIINTDGSDNNQSPIILTPVSGVVSSTTIYVKSNPTAIQFYSGNITHTSTGATTQNLPVESFGPATSLMLLLSAGGANSGGAITEYTIGGSTTLHKSFDASGANVSGNGPRGALMQASNGKLYGMTELGGANNVGTIFEFDAGTNTFTKLYDFAGTGLAGGASPYGTLVEHGGVLWGMTRFGGTSSLGNIFSFDYNSSTYTNRHTFTGASTGSQPWGQLLYYNGLFYGLTALGGANNQGVIFSFDPNSFLFTKLFDFVSGTDGTGQPQGNSLIQYNGILYGMTTSGAAGGQGCIFSYNPATSTYTVLYSFVGATGSIPRNNLLLASNGKMYGFTSFGTGINGTLFEFDLSTNTYTSKQNLTNATTGGGPQGSLVQAKKTKLYGLCTTGGASNNGTLIEYDLITETTTKLLDLVAATTGSTPQYTLPLPLI